ncbi:E3 ubiquitin-protein ligase RNF183 [Pungitius pungitius]|uniref:E3 ubiquitin-protein ligase RNF183 n=1 Tax=Pungitius pungitius TaxID=134920 RepID=UPI002E122D1E
MSDDQQGRAAPPAPNVKPKLGLTEKKEKPPKERRSRSTNSEREDGGRGRERDRHRGDRSRRRGRSEEARGRGGGDGARGAVRPPEDEVRDTECAVCFCSYDNVFRTPKLLACGHTFCLECLARINVTAPHLKTLSCPVCREPTKLPHGRDLPRLGTNKDVIGRLPPGMRRALSIRFQRRKGRLQLKNPCPALPRKGRGGTAPAGGGGNLGALELGVGAEAPATVVDVGRPPNRVRGRMRRLFRSDQCYYAVVASVITFTVVLMLVGVLAFVIIPNMPFNQRPGPGGNQTSDRPPG